MVSPRVLSVPVHLAIAGCWQILSSIRYAKASIVYKKEVEEMKSDNLMEITIPRNIQQLRNLRFKVCSEKGKINMGCLISHMVRPILYGR